MARIAKTLVLDRVADVILLYALGWTKRRIDELIEQSKPANISVDEFRSELATYYNLFNTQAYLPSLSGMPSQDDITAHRSQLYVRQLEIIEASDDELTTAVIDFLMAKANAVEYARRNLVNGTSFADFDATLQSTWKNRKKALELEANCKNDIHFGQRLANDCLGRAATLQGLVVPNNFTAGCFHALANQLEIGWHPHYGTMLSGAGS